MGDTPARYRKRDGTPIVEYMCVVPLPRNPLIIGSLLAMDHMKFSKKNLKAKWGTKARSNTEPAEPHEWAGACTFGSEQFR